MKLTKFNLLVFIATTFVTKSFSQQPKHYDIYSGFGIGGGMTLYDIKTDNFNTTEQKGWLVKATTTVDIPHKWYNMSYGMQISQNNLDVAGRLTETSEEIVPLNYSITGAQLSLLWHAKTLGGHLTFDLGPMVQYNSKLTLVDKEQEELIVNNFNKVTAKDIQDISNLHIVPAVGLTLGISHFKVSAQYLFTITNMLGKLNKSDLNLEDKEVDFKGHQHMITISGIFTFN